MIRRDGSSPLQNSSESGKTEQNDGNIRVINSNGSVIHSIQEFFRGKFLLCMRSFDSIATSKRGNLIPTVVFATSVAITGQAWKFEYDEANRNLMNRLNSELLEVIYPIQGRILTYEKILAGISGLFETQSSVSREEFKDFTNSINIGNNPEISGLSISFLLDENTISQHIKEIRSEGFPQYGEKIQLGRGSYAPVTYIEPLKGNNLKVIGYDNFTNSVRKIIMEIAHRTNSSALSEKLTLLQDTGKPNTGKPKAGFLMFSPFHSKSSTPQSEKSGWAALAFNIDDLMTNILGNQFQDLDISIYDGLKEDEASLIYKSPKRRDALSENTIKAIKTHTFGNREWTFVIHSTDEFQAKNHKDFQKNILVSGSLVTFLSTMLVWFLVRKRKDDLLALKKLKKTTQQLQESEKHYKALFEYVGVPMIVVDPKSGIITDANRMATKYYGYTKKEFIGMPVSNINTLPENEIQEKLKLAETKKKGEFEFQHKKASGEIRDVRVSTSLIYMSEMGRKLLSIIQDITEQKEAIEKIEEMATHDELTSLPNRRGLKNRLKTEILHAELKSSKIAILFLDLDNFKIINDSLGHHVGDELLCQVAERMKDSIRSYDTVSRLGGDEFIVLLSNIENPENAKRVAEKIIDSISEPFEIEGHEIHIGVSIGITIYPDHEKDIDELFKYGDSAMYKAKAGGRNTYRVFSPEMSLQTTEQQKLGTDLYHAIERHEFSTAFQPIIDATTGEITSMEGLLRWNHSELGNIPPSKFIPISESNGLIIPIGMWIFEDICAKIIEWSRLGINVPKIAVNISVEQLCSRNFLKDIIAIMTKYGVTPMQISLEITESMLKDNKKDAIDKLEILKDLGFSISIDDFGTGYSNFSSIGKTWVSVLKIDRSFIAHLENIKNMRLVEGIIKTAHDLEIKVVAEGVETEEQLKLLQNMKCDYLQGYYFSKPMNEGAMQVKLASGKGYNAT